MKLSKEQRKKILEALEEGVMEVAYFGEVYDWKNTEDLYKICVEQQQEIERLTKQNKSLNEMYELTKKEYIRLNDIINELEKWVEEDENKAMITFETGRCFNYHDIINKIEILKGVAKE